MAQLLQSRDYLTLLSRLLAAVAGAYAFTWGLTAFGLAGLVALGVNFLDAEITIFLLAFLVYLGLFIWAFAAQSLVRVWSVFGVGSVVTLAAAWILQHSLLG